MKHLHKAIDSDSDFPGEARANQSEDLPRARSETRRAGRTRKPQAERDENQRRRTRRIRRPRQSLATKRIPTRRHRLPTKATRRGLPRTAKPNRTRRATNREIDRAGEKKGAANGRINRGPAVPVRIRVRTRGAARVTSEDPEIRRIGVARTNPHLLPKEIRTTRLLEKDGMRRTQPVDLTARAANRKMTVRQIPGRRKAKVAVRQRGMEEREPTNPRPETVLDRKR